HAMTSLYTINHTFSMIRLHTQSHTKCKDAKQKELCLFRKNKSFLLNRNTPKHSLHLRKLSWRFFLKSGYPTNTDRRNERSRCVQTRPFVWHHPQKNRSYFPERIDPQSIRRHIGFWRLLYGWHRTNRN